MEATNNQRYRAWDLVAKKMLAVSSIILDGGSIQSIIDCEGITHQINEIVLMKSLGIFEWIKDDLTGIIKGEEFFEFDIIQTTHYQKLTEEEQKKYTHIPGPTYTKSGIIEPTQSNHIGYRIRWDRGHMVIQSKTQVMSMKAIKRGNKFENPELISKFKLDYTYNMKE